MSEGKESSENELSPEVRELFARARAGKVSPAELANQLNQLGIKGFMRMFYMGRAYGWPLKKVKEMYIKEQHGSVEAWADEIEDMLDQMDLEEEEIGHKLYRPSPRLTS